MMMAKVNALRRIVAYLDSFPLSRVLRDRQARLASHKGMISLREPHKGGDITVRERGEIVRAVRALSELVGRSGMLPPHPIGFYREPDCPQRLTFSLS